MRSPRWYRMEGRDAFMDNVPFEKCPYKQIYPFARKHWKDGWEQAQQNYVSEKKSEKLDEEEQKLRDEHDWRGHPECTLCFPRKPKTINTKRFLVFAGQEFYANGGANDLVSTSCKTEEKAIEYARSLLDKKFTTNHWCIDDLEDPITEMTIEWVQVFDLEKCEVIFRRGKVHGDDSGIVIL